MRVITFVLVATALIHPQALIVLMDRRVDVPVSLLREDQAQMVVPLKVALVEVCRNYILPPYLLERPTRESLTLVLIHLGRI